MKSQNLINDTCDICYIPKIKAKSVPCVEDGMVYYYPAKLSIKCLPHSVGIVAKSLRLQELIYQCITIIFKLSMIIDLFALQKYRRDHFMYPTI